MFKFVMCKKTTGGEIVELDELEDVVSFRYTESLNADLQKSGSIEHLKRYEGGTNLVRCYRNDEVQFTMKLRNLDESLLESDAYSSTLYDCCYFLDAKKTVNKYSIPSGANIATYIRTLCSAVGVQVRIDDLRLILSKTAVFDEGTSYLEMINTLLDMCSYQRLHTDEMGYVVVAKNKDVRDGFDYTITARNTYMLNEQTRQSIGEDVPNAVALVYEGELWNLVGLAYNNDADSEFSLQNRGYELTSVEKVNDVGTENATQYEIQSALDKLANDKMQKLKRNEQKYNISVLMNRRYAVNDYAYVETEDGAYSLYVIESLAYDSKAGTRCDMTIATVA